MGIKIEVQARVIIGYILLAMGIIIITYGLFLGVSDYYFFKVSSDWTLAWKDTLTLALHVSMILITLLAGSLISKRAISMILGSPY